MDFGSGSSNREKGKAFTLHHYTKTIYDKAKTFNRVFPLHDYFKPMIGNKKEVKIADLGAGMYSTTGSTLKGVKVDLYPSDEMSNEFNGQLKKFKIKPVFPIEYQNMERLSYPDEMFDIVHCVNALDHCINPYKALKEMYRVCKKGGWIYLRHHFNTARLQKYRGEHKWNMIITIDKDCLFWGTFGNFLLSDCVPGFTNEPKKELKEVKYNMIVSKLQK